jgi:hypothetical protein
MFVAKNEEIVPVAKIRVFYAHDTEIAQNHSKHEFWT